MNTHTQLVAYRTIVTKEVRRFSRIWVQTILPPVITTALYFIIFGQLIGSQLSDVQGFSYMDYIVPGIILMTVITNSYANVVSSFYSSKFGRFVEEMLIAPIPNYVILLGYLTGGVARGLAVGAAVTAVAAFFTDIRTEHLALSVFVVVLTSFLFSLGGFINAVYAKSFDDISIIPTFVLTPLTYLGGVFYSVQMLPEFWQEVSRLNPILYMVNAFRYGLLGVSDVSASVAVSVILAFIAVLYAYCLWLLRRGVGLRS
ncbi:MAG: ABC transporter permease [Thiohalomonadaceae bacterium]